VRPQVCLVATHDDGLGGFVIGARLVWALLRLAEKDGAGNLRPVFLCRKDLSHLREAHLDRFDSPVGLIAVDNLLVLPKDRRRGEVAPAGLPPLLEALARGVDTWAGRIAWDRAAWVSRRGAAAGEPPVDLRDVRLCISVGVPYLHAFAKRLGVPSVEVGDWSVSTVMRGCLEDAGLRGPEHDGPLARLAECERLAAEVWLLPYAAPVEEYRRHYAAGGKTVSVVDGVFGLGARPGWDLPEDAAARAGAIRRELLEARPNNGLVWGVHAGGSGVWTGLLEALEGRPPGDASQPLLVTVTPGTGAVRLLEALRPPRTWRLPAGMPSPLGWYRNEDICITRGGMTALDHVAVRCPLAVVEEPNHWLGRMQRRQLVEAGLGVPVSRDDLRGAPGRAAAEIGRWFRDGQAEEVKRRMHEVPVDGHEKLAAHVYEKFLRA